MTNDKSKLSLSHRLKLRDVELQCKRQQEARLKTVLTRQAQERAILDAQDLLEYLELRVARGRGFAARAAMVIGKFFGKDVGNEVQLTADELLRFPEVEVARLQLQRRVREFASTALKVGDAVSDAITGDTEQTPSENEAPEEPPSGSLSQGAGRSKWG